MANERASFTFKPSASSRDYAFTIWVVEPETVEQLFDGPLQPYTRGIVCQEELSPETLAIHLQGHVRFHNPLKGTRVQDLFEEALHHRETHLCQAAMPAKSVKYCRKKKSRTEEGAHWEEGDLEYEQGKRSDILEIRDKLEAGEGWATIVPEHFGTYVRCFNGLAKARSHLWRNKINNDKSLQWREIHTYVFWGDAGAGKSRAAHAMFEFKDIFKLRKGNGGNAWFNNYDWQPVLMLNEFNGSWMPLHSLLDVIDGYPCEVEEKGGHVWANWTTIIFTAQHHPSKWYPNADIQEQIALQRRLNVIREYSLPKIKKEKMIANSWSFGGASPTFNSNASVPGTIGAPAPLFGNGRFERLPPSAPPIDLTCGEPDYSSEDVPRDIQCDDFDPSSPWNDSQPETEMDSEIWGQVGSDDNPWDYVYDEPDYPSDEFCDPFEDSSDEVSSPPDPWDRFDNVDYSHKEYTYTPPSHTRQFLKRLRRNY